MPKLKICGNHRAEDIRIIMEHIERIDYVGFIFTPKSKRFASVEQVANWIQEFPGLADKAVAVFLDQDVEEMVDILQKTNISIAQLHGHERVKDIIQLNNSFEGMKDAQLQKQIWKVIHIEAIQRTAYNHNSLLGYILEKMEQYRDHVDAFLLDTKSSGQLGGTGQTFDWSLVGKIHASLIDDSIPVWVAGGINDQNVGELVSHYPVYGIDVASGVETNRIKDRVKLNNLIEGVSMYEAK